MSLTAELAPGPTPQQSTRAFTEAINNGDLRAAAHCFALDACLTTPDATTIRGRDEIRPILAQLIARGSQIEVLARSILIAGEVALGSERRAIRSAGAEGVIFEQRLSRPWCCGLSRTPGSWRSCRSGACGPQARPGISAGERLTSCVRLLTLPYRCLQQRL